MKLKPFRQVPVLLALGVIGLVCLARGLRWEWPERLERLTFDMRARKALEYSPPAATNLGFVFINEESNRRIADGSVGLHFGREWPRQVYGRLIRELADQGAKAVALDIVFGELRPDHAPVQMADRPEQPGPESDDFFATEMRRAGNVILAVTPDVTLPSLFLTNAAAVGDIQTDKDRPEGILRRAKAFRTYRKWHLAFRQMEADPTFGVDLAQARVEPRRLVFPRRGLETIEVPLDENGDFDLADFVGDKLPPGLPRKAKPVTEERIIWHMGVQLAACELGLDLTKAVVDLERGSITLKGTNGVRRVIPVDTEGYFYVDWHLPPNDPRLTQESIQDLLAQYRSRPLGRTEDVTNRWRGKLVVVGSSAVVGSNLTDRGATPTSADTILVSKHWNIASSIILGRFVRRVPAGVDFCLILGLGMLGAIVTRQVRVLLGSAVLVVGVLAYAAFAVVLYIQTRYWIPVVLPIAALLLTHVSLVTWRVIFEQAEQRRVRSIFSTIVSPKIVAELLEAKALSLGGARREVTVMFADVRGFTQLVDASQEYAAERIRREKLTGPTAEACIDQQARETLETVNQYLGLVADTVIQQDGTLDKFIGDCVMAFWGAPTANTRHALTCVRAAIQAQQVIYDLNRQRVAENQRRATENRTRASAGVPALPLLPVLFVGAGINTGMATVGLMGSASRTTVRQGNYTVFGREVNLASRLESVSGRGRIFIGETTYQHLLRDDPTLASSCVAQPVQRLKGISTAVQIYEVPWRLPEMPPLEEETPATGPAEAKSATAPGRQA